MKSALVLFTSALVLALAVSQQYPFPGAISGSVSIPSINNILNTMVPILSYYTFNNKTVEINYEKEGLIYTINIEDIHIDDVTGWTVKEAEFIDGTDSVRFRFSGININAQINGTIQAVYFIELKGSTLNITNLTFELDVGVSSSDQIHWKLLENSSISVGDVEITTTSKFYNKILKMMHKEIMKIINNFLPQVEQLISQEVQKFDDLLKNENSTTFLVDMFESPNLLFNLTCPAAPTLTSESGLFEFFIDGLIYDVDHQTTHIQKTFNQYFPPREKNQNTEQFWMHQSLLNSFFLSYGKHYMPLHLNNTNVTQLFLMFFPEIKEYYGNDVNLAFEVSLNSESEFAIDFISDTGIVAGPEDTIVFQMDVYASNSTNGPALAAEFQNFFQMTLNATMYNFVFYFSIPDFNIHSTNITINNCNIGDRQYDTLFSSIIGMIQDDLNLEFQNGLDLKKNYPTVGFIAGMFQEFTITPYVIDEFLYAGFKFMTDKPSQMTDFQAQKEAFIQ